jgi:hypothetical protein
MFKRFLNFESHGIMSIRWNGTRIAQPRPNPEPEFDQLSYTIPTSTVIAINPDVSEKPMDILTLSVAYAWLLEHNMSMVFSVSN